MLGERHVKSQFLWRHGNVRIKILRDSLRFPSKLPVGARTVLAGKGSLRRAKQRRALARCAPF